MARRWIAFVVLLGVGAVCCDRSAAQAPLANPRAKSFKIANCLVSLIRDIEIAAKRSGNISALSVKEGSTVAAGDVVGAIDKAQAEMQCDVARAEHESARARALSAVEIQAAENAYRSASTEYAASVDANRLSARAYSIVQLDKLQLAVKDAQMRIEAAKLEQAIEVIEDRIAEAKVRLAQVEIIDRTLVAPVEGQVVEVFRQKDEWVEVGRPILRIVQLDRLRVEGFVKFAEHAPEELAGRKLKATVVVAGGETRTFPGEVVFVNPVLQHGGQFRIWAEVENKGLGLRPGVEVELEILGEQ
ncbi:MAG: HlyD family efflux transporter periplasmic adaptor subunit [Planctomycetia bacterium]|nr:HlyD family efflux transporter periplasmic adaptor subunit [Planctomycetia bacterium]